MTEVLDQPVIDLPPIDAALIDAPAPRTDVAVAAAAALDLAKVDLTDVALAQFGPWRQSVAEVQQNIATLALDLSIQARIDEAKSLRRRLFDQPRADIRKVSKDLKSKLAKVSKAIGAEEDAAVAAYDEAEKPLTAQIEAAQKIIDDEKEAKRQAENVRLSGLREAVDAIMAKWLERCNAEGMTAERLGKGIEGLELTPTPAEVIDVAEYWRTKKQETLQVMDKLKAAAAAREEAARLEAQRLENERIAAEQARVAAELAERQRALAEQAAALARQAEAIEAARQRAITPAVACVKDSLTHEPAATEGKADTPEPGKLEAAPIQRSGGQPIVMGAAVASGPLHPSTEDDWDEIPACPGCGAMAGCCQDFPNCPGGQPVPAVHPANSNEENHDDESDRGRPRRLAGEGDAVEPGQRGEPDERVRHDGGPEHDSGLLRAFPSGTAHQGDAEHSEACGRGLTDTTSGADAVLGGRGSYAWKMNEARRLRDYTGFMAEANKAVEAVRAAQLCDTDDHGADLLLDPGTAAAEAAEFAELEAIADGPPGGFVTSDLLDACADFVALVAQARGTNFPSQPKMGPEWWTALYAAADKMLATGEVL